jgi:hypothetical protein
MHGEPTYSKRFTSQKNKSKSHHSILQKHEKKLLEFKEKKKQINQLQHQIDRLQNAKQHKESHKEQMNELENHMKTLLSDEDEFDYLLDSSFLIMTYAELEKQEDKLLNSESASQNIDELNAIIKQKADITHEYLSKFDPHNSSLKHLIDFTANICKQCSVYMTFEEGFLVCSLCGHCISTVDASGDLSYKEMQEYDYRTQFTYDKKSHLEDWIRRFQSKENRVIPQDVIDKVILETKKERLKDLNLLTEEKVKRYLKRLGLNEYYDNVIGIINRINNRPPFKLTAEIERKIKMMFQQIQEPYEKHKPPSRRNFLSYSYCLHKFFQILGLHEFAKYFPLLKSADKLRQQDEIFKKIVAEMATKDKSINWLFYPSI